MNEVNNEHRRLNYAKKCFYKPSLVHLTCLLYGVLTRWTTNSQRTYLNCNEAR